MRREQTEFSRWLARKMETFIKFESEPRFCATTAAARRSGSLARTGRIPAAGQSPMSPRAPISSLERDLLRRKHILHF